jgi:hypothetical protein
LRVTLIRMSAGRGSGFVDPRAALEQEYNAAVERLRREVGDPRTLADKWRFWRSRRRLWKKMVGKPRRSADW